MKSITIILIFLVGVTVGAFGMHAYILSQVPEIGLQKAQGCYVDGYIRHADGTFNNNWVCIKP